jgi:heme A synthase
MLSWAAGLAMGALLTTLAVVMNRKVFMHDTKNKRHVVLELVLVILVLGLLYAVYEVPAWLGLNRHLFLLAAILFTTVVLPAITIRDVWKRITGKGD